VSAPPAIVNAMNFSFELKHTSGGARSGLLRTGHGEVPTPAFMPVGTQGAVKGATPQILGEIGVRMILANTYHLVMRPGSDLIAKLGGLHRFMGWDGPILTDSGGFQILSLEGLRKVSRDGISFRSHVDGSLHLFTPESAIEHQAKIGADVIMSFDYCTGYPCDRKQADTAVTLTGEWARRGRSVFGPRFEMGGYERVLFGIVQGSTHLDLRERSLAEILALDFPGYAIGGLSVGEDSESTWRVTEAVTRGLPADRPRYLMGMGTPADLVEGVSRGVDMFDCVMPTRNARNGTVFTRRGKIVLRNASHASEGAPIDDRCGCYTCRNFSRAYLRHLFNAGEMVGPVLATYHSLYYYSELMREMRAAIERGEFSRWREAFAEQYQSAAPPGA
jgi:queuine tRNA-ribosyltransferase